MTRASGWIILAILFVNAYVPLVLGGMAEWTLLPGASISADYSDNRFLQLAHAEESNRFVSALELGVQRQTEHMNLSLKPRFTSVNYMGDYHLNRDDQFADARAEWSRELFQVAVGARYARESTATTELESTGLVATDKTRQAYSIDPHWSYQLSDTSMIRSSLDYAWVDYEDAQFTGLVNYWNGSGTIDYRVEASDVSSWSVGGYGSKMRSAALESETREYGIQLQLDHDWSSDLMGSLRVGSRRGKLAYQFFSNEIEFIDEGWSMTAKLDGQRRWGDWSANASRSSQASGAGFVQLVDRISFHISHGLSESISVYATALRARFQEQRADAVARDYTRGELGADWVLTSSARLKASYVWYAQQREGIAGRASANALSLTLEWRDVIPSSRFSW